MKKHMTTGEVLKVKKLVADGITDVETIQTVVFSDASVIQPFIDKFLNEGDPELAALQAKAEKERAEAEEAEAAVEAHKAAPKKRAAPKKKAPAKKSAVKAALDDLKG